MQFMVNDRYGIDGTLFGLKPCEGGLYLRAGNLEAVIERVTYGGKPGDFGSEGWFEKWEDSSLNFRLCSWRLMLDLPAEWRERGRRWLGFSEARIQRVPASVPSLKVCSPGAFLRRIFRPLKRLT